jgi:hypothetical protein
MIKCFFIDVKSISCDVPRSNFTESDLEQLANFILEADGLIRPLILKEIGLEKYLVIDGYREYYGALRAKEKDLKKAEMVNAFVISPKIERGAVAQLKLLSENAQPITNLEIPSETKETGIEQLLPALASIISQQLQPLTQQISSLTSQLAEQKEMLALLAKDRPVITPKPAQEEGIKIPLIEVVKVPEVIKPSAAEIKVVEIVKSVVTQPKKVKEKDKLAEGSPVGSEIALDLINRLSLTDLSLKMQQVKIPNAVKLVTSIITARNKQPDNKFDCWKTFISEVKGLGPKIAQIIADKLR